MVTKFGVLLFSRGVGLRKREEKFRRHQEGSGSEVSGSMAPGLGAASMS